MHKMRFLITSCIVILVAVSSSLYVFATNKYLVTAEQKEMIENAFSELKDQNNPLGKSNYIISGDDIKISKSEFDFYKVNIKLMNQLNAKLDNSSDKIASFPTDQELIDEMKLKRL